MSQAIIGALRVVLGMDSAAFEKGATEAQKRVASLQKSMAKTAKNLKNVGANLSAGITAPIAAIGGSALAAANSLGELQQLADIAGVSADRFKILQLAASEYGIEQEKLSDILKDTNDKFGDFFATGAGPLADFFENIAPKVGLTEEAFKGLSSEQALGKYVKALEDAGVNQQEMTFYLEALASDATALVPAFSNGAAAIQEMEKRASDLGLALDGDAIQKAKAARDEFRLLADITKTRLQAALVELLPAFTTLANSLVPLVEGIVTGISSMAAAFADLSPKTQALISKGIALAAALGPLAVALGVAVAALKPLAGLILALSSPIGIVVAALGTLTIAIYRNWDAVQEAFGGAIETIKTFFADAKETFIQGNLAFAQFGMDLINGLIQGLKDRIAAVRDTVVGVADNVKGWFKNALGIQSPSKVFNEFGKNIIQGLKNGIDANSGKLKGTLENLEPVLKKTEIDLGQIFKSGVSGAESLSDAIKGVGQNLADVLLQTGAKSLGASIGGLLGGSGGFLGKLFSFDGGGFTGNGARTGGVDGKGGFPAILHPNETVIDHTKGQSSGMVRIVIEEAPGFASRVVSLADNVAVERIQMATKQNDMIRART